MVDASAFDNPPATKLFEGELRPETKYYINRHRQHPIRFFRMLLDPLEGQRLLREASCISAGHA